MIEPRLITWTRGPLGLGVGRGPITWTCRQRHTFHISRAEHYTLKLQQVEACLNLRPLAAMLDSDKGIEILTPGNFLFDSPLEALLDPPASICLIRLLRRWHLCQAVTPSTEELVCGVPRPATTLQQMVPHLSKIEGRRYCLCERRADIPPKMASTSSYRGYSR